MNTDRARDVLFDALGDLAPDVDPTALDPAASLRDQADLDSIDFLELVSRLSAAVSGNIPEADYDQLDSVSTAVQYLAARQA